MLLLERHCKAFCIPECMMSSYKRDAVCGIFRISLTTEISPLVYVERLVMQEISFGKLLGEGAQRGNSRNYYLF